MTLVYIVVVLVLLGVAYMYQGKEIENKRLEEELKEQERQIKELKQPSKKESKHGNDFSITNRDGNLHLPN